MASVRVRTEDFEDGVFPRVCVSSGCPADRLYLLDQRYTPPWVLFALLLGPVGVIVAILMVFAFSRRVKGYLPFSDTAQQCMRKSRSSAGIAVALGGTVLVLGLLALALTVSLAIVAIVGLAVTVLALVRVARPRGSVGMRPEPDSRWIVLRPVSATFAEAYETQNAQRRLDRQAAQEPMF